MTGRSVKNKQEATGMPKIVDKIRRRREIADAALDLFAQRGFERTAIREISAAAGMGKGTFYDYFSDKEDLLGGVIQLIFAEWTARIAARLAPLDDPLDQLRTMVIEGAALGQTFEKMMLVYVDVWRRAVSRTDDRTCTRRFRGFLMESRQAVAGICETAKDRGLIRRDIDTAAMATGLIALIDGLCLHRMMMPAEFDNEAVARAVCDALLAGLG